MRGKKEGGGGGEREGRGVGQGRGGGEREKGEEEYGHVPVYMQAYSLHYMATTHTRTPSEREDFILEDFSCVCALVHQIQLGKDTNGTYTCVL